MTVCGQAVLPIDVHMEAFGLLCILVAAVAVIVGGIGFVLGYFVGRRSRARQWQAGFPLSPIEPPAEQRR